MVLNAGVNGLGAEYWCEWVLNIDVNGRRALHWCEWSLTLWLFRSG